MKTKRTILGVVLTVMLLGSFMAVATPASAGTLSWTDETLPGARSQVIVTSNITDIAVATGGDVIYAVCGASVAADALFRSTDRGKSWTAITPEAGRADLIAVAPDDENWIAVADNNTGYVYISDDAGSSWDTLPVIEDDGDAGTFGTLNMTGGRTIINDIAVSALRSDVHYVAVAGTDNSTFIRPNIFIYNAGSSVPAWDELATKGGFQGWVDYSEVQAVAFSPNYASDKVLTAVTSEAGVAAYLQIYSFDSGVWNDAAAFTDDYPVSLTTEALDEIMAAEIALAPDYLGSDDAMRLAFVGMSINGTNDAIDDSGIYRLEDDSSTLIRDDRLVNSVAYDGTNVVAGRFDNVTVYRSDNPLASSPTFKSTATLKSPSGANQVIVAWAGDDVVAATFGDESAFSISSDNGKSFNSISLIDTTMDVLYDVAVSADGSSVFLVTTDDEDTTGTADDDLSVWRYVSKWERVLSVKGARNFIARMAPDDPDVLYLGEAGGTGMYYTADAGETRWQSRVCKVEIQDLAVESADVIYAVDDGGDLSKSSNSGFTWGTTKSTKRSTAHTIASLSEDNVLVGSGDGYVSYSTDGGSTFTLLDNAMGGAANLTQVAATGLDDGDFVFAATDALAGTYIYYWELGEDDEWDEMMDADVVPDGQQVTGLSYHDSILYAVTVNATASWLYRTINPTGDTVYWRTKSSAAEQFNATPSALKTSTHEGYTKLWAICTAGTNELYSYKDTLAHLTPTLKTPTDGYTIGHYREGAGKAESIAFTWENPSDSIAVYDVAVALDEGFDEAVLDNVHLDGDWDEGDTVSVVIGVDSPAAGFNYGWQPGKTYYWKVRVDGTETRSGWSEVRTLKVEEEELAPAPVVIQPAPPAPSITLPQPKVEVTVPPPTEVKIPPAPPPPAAPAPITPAYIWATIIIGAILVIALIVLIFRTRRVS